MNKKGPPFHSFGETRTNYNHQLDLMLITRPPYPPTTRLDDPNSIRTPSEHQSNHVTVGHTSRPIPQLPQDPVPARDGHQLADLSGRNPSDEVAAIEPCEAGLCRCTLLRPTRSVHHWRLHRLGSLPSLAAPCAGDRTRQGPGCDPHLRGS